MSKMASLMQEVDHRREMEKAHYWHEFKWGVPCGPTLRMISGYYECVEDYLYRNMSWTLREAFYRAVIGKTPADISGEIWE